LFNELSDSCFSLISLAIFDRTGNLVDLGMRYILLIHVQPQISRLRFESKFSKLFSFGIESLQSVTSSYNLRRVA